MLIDSQKFMMNEFDMTKSRLMHYFFGIEIMQSSLGVFISQKKNVLQILDKFMMKDYNSISNPIEPGLKLSNNDA